LKDWDSARLQELAIWSEERVRPVERSDRDLMGHEMAKTFARKPGVEMEGRPADDLRRSHFAVQQSWGVRR
jgi:hypothetical protein